MKNLTPKELAFCEGYVRTRNANQSALDAGYSWKTARALAHTLLRKPHIKEYISQLTQKVATVAVADATTVVNGYAQIAFATPFDVLEPDEKGLWKGMAPDQLPSHIKPAIKKVHVKNLKNKDGTTRQEFRYELYDKMDALDKLGKHFDVFGEKAPSTVNFNQYAQIPTDKLEKLQSAFRDVIEGEYAQVPDNVPALTAVEPDDESGSMLAERNGEHGRDPAGGPDESSDPLGAGDEDVYEPPRYPDDDTG
jgi:phage terminase small subunit